MFVVVYFDDILIFSKIEVELLQYLKSILEALKVKKLYLNLKKCEFLSNKLLFLQFIVIKEGIIVDEPKVKVIREWQTPKAIHKV